MKRTGLLNGGITAALMLGALSSACLSKTMGSLKSLTGTAASLAGSSSSSDGAQDQCALIDTSSPQRLICTDCYDTLLATYCPGKSSASQCTDATVRNTFPNRINQCIAATTVAGFTCTKTCSSGQTLDAATCTCVTPSGSSGSGSNGGSTDSGQFDFGPPVATLSWPSSSLKTELAGVGLVGPTSCSSSFTGYLGVRNRGGSVTSLNVYTQVSSGLIGTPALNGAGGAWLSGLSNPTAVLNGSVGQNARVRFSLNTGGVSELPATVGGSSPSGYAGITVLLSGSSTQGVSGTTYTQSSDDDVSALDAYWTNRIDFGARDRWGNLYFSDTSGHTIRVICYDTDAHGGLNYHCSGRTQGYIYTVVGAANTTGSSTAGAASAATITSPKGIAIDQYGNVFFATQGAGSSTGYLLVVCGGTSGYCTARTAGNLYSLASGVDRPSGLDIVTSGATVNVYYAETGQNRVMALCGFAGDGVFCGATGSIAGATGVVFSSPTDVKINWNKNVFIADNGNHRILALCNDVSTGDLCNSQTVGTFNVIFGNSTGIAAAGTAGNSADGTTQGTVSGHAISSPYALAIPKRYADDLGVIDPLVDPEFYRDNNLVFTESYYASSGVYGNTVKILCGDNSAGYVHDGFCAGKTVGGVYRLAGSSGVKGYSNLNTGKAAAQAVFSYLAGVTYDLNKNLVVSSGDLDRTLRAILFTVQSPRVGVKYSIRDNQGLTSYYCLQAQALTACVGNLCYCDSSIPLESGKDAWIGASVTSACPSP